MDARPKADLKVNAACVGATTADISVLLPLMSQCLAKTELVTPTLGANDLAIRGLAMACSTMGW